MTTRFLTFAAVAAFAFSAAHGAPQGSLAAAILDCSALPDDQAQLACFRNIAAKLKTLPAAQPQSTAQAAPVAPLVPQRTAPPAPQQAAKQEDSSWYDVGGWFGSEKEKQAQPSRVIGTPADFGNESMRFASDKPQQLDHITAGVKSVSANFFKRFTVTLDNGQVWQQANSDTAIARFSEDKKDTVTITRGILSTYTLKIEGRHGIYRVQRIK